MLQSSPELSDLFYFPSSEEAVDILSWPRWAACYVPCVHLDMLSTTQAPAKKEAHTLQSRTTHPVIFLWPVWVKWSVTEFSKKPHVWKPQAWLFSAPDSTGSGLVSHLHHPTHTYQRKQAAAQPGLVSSQPWLSQSRAQAACHNSSLHAHL